jgi:putative spermidine/putrescine transport system ATP-binding protein
MVRAQSAKTNPPTEDKSSPLDPETESGGVSLRGLSKSFGDVSAVANLHLDVKAGEFFSMLGPSGSGKTTVLRLIAGFETATSGKVYLDQVDVTDRAPFDRDVNTVFQDYALFPHMTIQENVEYGLRAKGMAKPERAKAAAEAIERVKLGHLAGRLPHQLSGGQRQRIALARALVLRPKVLLLDEPLGALDKQLREEMQVELKRIQREAGITFVFVTHDQEEAMRLSDRMAVFNNGKIEQIGTPREVYDYPATPFVAGFLGVSNLLPARALGLVGDRLANIRPERVKLLGHNEKAPSGWVTAEATISNLAYAGAVTILTVDLKAGQSMIVTVLNEELPGQGARFAQGDSVTAMWQKAHVAELPNSAN